jgi:hypothetical protein
MKIKFIFKENKYDNFGLGLFSDSDINLSSNPYDMKIITMLGLHIKHTKKYEPIKLGWLYPDGRGMELQDSPLHFHGDIMRLVDRNYDQSKTELQGPVDFGKLTGAMRIGAPNAIEIFTKLSQEQLAYIRRNCRGERFTLVVTEKLFQSKTLTIGTLSDGYWLQELNKKLMENNLVDFNPLLESKTTATSKNWLRYNVDIINKFAERSISYEIFKENFGRLGRPIKSFFDIVKETFRVTHGNKKQEFYNILVTKKIKKTLGAGNWGITFLLEDDMVLKIGFSRSGPDINEIDKLERFSGKYPKELLDFKKLQNLLFSEKADLQDLMVYDYGNINNLLYYVLESKVYPFENKRISSTASNNINAFFYMFNNFMRDKKIPPKSYSKRNMWDSFLDYLEENKDNPLATRTLMLFDRNQKLFNKTFNYLYNRLRTRGGRILEDLDSDNLGSLNPLEKDEDLLADDNPWVQFDF